MTATNQSDATALTENAFNLIKTPKHIKIIFPQTLQNVKNGESGGLINFQLWVPTWKPIACPFPAPACFWGDLVLGSSVGHPLDRFWPPLRHLWSDFVAFWLDFNNNVAPQLEDSRTTHITTHTFKKTSKNLKTLY